MKARLKIPITVSVERLVCVSMWSENVLGQGALGLLWSVNSATLMRRKVMSSKGERRRRKEEGKQLKLKGQGERWFPVRMWKGTEPYFYPSPSILQVLCLLISPAEGAGSSLYELTPSSNPVPGSFGSSWWCNLKNWGPCLRTRIRLFLGMFGNGWAYWGSVYVSVSRLIERNSSQERGEVCKLGSRMRVEVKFIFILNIMKGISRWLFRKTQGGKCKKKKSH